MFNIQVEWDDLDAAFEALETECSEVVRGIAVEAWNRVLEQTPQLLGRLVASWSFTLNAPIAVDRSFAAELDTPEPLAKGDPAAIDTANFYNRGADDGFRLGMDIFFANGADHGEGPYAAEIEAGLMRLRPVNHPGRMAARAFDHIQLKYQDVTGREAEVLRNLRIGG